jgi:hypothetical protein
MSGHRQAAVALHALAEEDRRLILAQLPAADQSTLRGYLAELAELGFDGDSMALNDAVAVAKPVPAAPDLAHAAPATMLRLLENEPASLVAQVLALEQWRWRAGMLALSTPARRDAILAAHVSPAPARARFLRQSLAARLAAMAPDQAPARTSLLASVVRWGSAWRR